MASRRHGLAEKMDERSSIVSYHKLRSFSFPTIICILVLWYVEQTMLSPTGVLYMILVQDNKPNDVASILSRYHLKSKVNHISYIPTCQSMFIILVGAGDLSDESRE